MPPVGRACVSKSCETPRAQPPTGNWLPIWRFRKSPYPASEFPEAPAFGTQGCKPELATLPPELATLLDKDCHYLRNKHLIPMVRDGLLKFRYPEGAKHPNHAYVAAGDNEVRRG